MHITINLKSDNLARELRSLAAKVDTSAVVPGADVRVGNARIQVAERQEHPIRAFARANGWTVGERGRFSKALQEAYAADVAEKAKAEGKGRAKVKA